jgi:multisubunit Na+/H+ antiporter MnhB subunit
VTTTSTRRRPKRRPARKTIVVVVGLVVAFAVGIALGQALHDNPRPGGVQTTVRTLPPLTETGG